MTYLLSVLTIDLVLALISWPISAKLLGNFKDSGYAASRVVGLLVISYTHFVLANLKLAPFDTTTLFVICGVWIVLNGIVLVHYQKTRAIYNSPQHKHLLAIIITTETVKFLLAYIVFWIRNHGAEIYQIERFMDFGMLSTLTNAHTLPPLDFWMANETVNYYYFGFVAGVNLLKLSGTALVPGFFALIAWLFGVLCITLFACAKTFAFTQLNTSKKSFIATLIGILSVFFIMISGPIHSAEYLFNNIKCRAAHCTTPPTYWYADPTRFIKGTITEPIYFGFLVADLHAHMWGLLPGILTLIWVVSYIQNGKSTFTPKSALFWSASFILIIGFLTNPWDIFIYSAIIATSVIVKDTDRFVSNILNLVIMISVVYIGILPWTATYKAPVSGIAWVYSRSTIYQLLLFWGQFALPLIVYIATFRTKATRWVLALLGVVLVFITATELIAVKDILATTEWYRANTVFKIWHKSWLILGFLAAFSYGAVLNFYITKKHKIAQTIVITYGLLIVGVTSFYPIVATKQAFLTKRYNSVSNALEFWKNNYPANFGMYTYLNDIKNRLPNKSKSRIIIEADGDSYTDTNFLSAFLGWPTVIGWSVHEWTHRGSYNEIAKRKNDVTALYTSPDETLKKAIVEKYNIDYVIASEIEYQKYGNYIFDPVLKKLGNVVFIHDNYFIVKTSSSP